MIRIEKLCKECCQPFVIEYEIHGSGSSGPARKKYCSQACKIAFSKKENAFFKQEQVICKICNKPFFSFSSQAKNRVTCSKQCYRQHMSMVNSKEPKIIKKCPECDSCFSKKNQKFCSPECFNKSQRNRKQIQCLVCDKIFEIKKSHSAKFCDKFCARKAQSSGMIKSHTNGRSGNRIDIENSPYFKSSLEADYARYCIYKNIPFVYEAKVFLVELENTNRCYTPDFYHPHSEEFIELKGIQLNGTSFSKLLNSNSPAREKLAQQGVNIKVIYMNDFYQMLKDLDIYDKIPNLENKNYAKTAHLIRAHEDPKDRDNSS